MSKLSERIAERALHLLQASEDPQWEMAQTEHLMDEAGIGVSRPDRSRPRQWVMDLLENNPLLTDWLNANQVNLENLLHAETLEDLALHLTPSHSLD